MSIVRMFDTALGDRNVSMAANLSRQIFTAGQGPGAIGADNVCGVYTLPAGFFDATGKGIRIRAFGAVANNTASKDIKIIIGASSAVVGQTIGSGGTTISDTGAYTTTGAAGFDMEASIFRTGKGAQIAFDGASYIGAAPQGIINAPAALSLDDTKAIIIAVTINCVTAITDALLYGMFVDSLN